MLREIDAICSRNSMVKSKFIQRGVQMAIDDANKRFGEAANEPAIKPPAVVLRAVTSPPVEHIKRGTVIWFDMQATCAHLGITVAALLTEIDPDDDVLAYAGKSWIDATGIAEARALCSNTALSDSLGAFTQSKEE